MGYLHNRAWLTFIVLKALGRGAAAPRVVRGLLPPVVPGVDVASKLYEHLDEVDVLYLGCMMKGGLVKFSCIYIGPWKARAENGCHQSESMGPRERLTDCTHQPLAERKSNPRPKCTFLKSKCTNCSSLWKCGQHPLKKQNKSSYRSNVCLGVI